MANFVRHAISFGLLLVLTLFLIVAFSGNNGDAQGYTQNFYETDTCKYYVWYGMEGYKADSSECDDFNAPREYTKWTDDSMTDVKYTDSCKEAGGGVVSMLTFGLIALIVTLGVTFMRLRDMPVPLMGGRLMNVIALGALAAFMFFGWTSWFACHDAIVEELKDTANTTITLSTGFAMVFLNMLLAIVVLVNEVLIPDDEGPMANHGAEAPAGGGQAVPDNSDKQMDPVV